MWNRLSDENLTHLKRNASEGPGHYISLCKEMSLLGGDIRGLGGGGGGGRGGEEIPGLSPCMKHCHWY